MQHGMANPSVAKLYAADCKRRTGACWITVSQLRWDQLHVGHVATASWDEASNHTHLSIYIESYIYMCVYMHIGAHIYLCFKPWKTQILVSFSSNFIQHLGFTEWLDPYPKSGVLSRCVGGKTLAEIHQTPQGALGGTGLWVSRPESTPQSAKKHTQHITKRWHHYSYLQLKDQSFTVWLLWSKCQAEKEEKRDGHEEEFAAFRSDVRIWNALGVLMGQL